MTPYTSIGHAPARKGSWKIPAHCQRCRKEETFLHAKLIWIDGLGLFSVQLCQTCVDAIKQP